jgi:hypothetical protein
MPRKRKAEAVETVDGPNEDGIDDPGKDPFEDDDFDPAEPVLKGKKFKAKRPIKPRLQAPE